MRIDRLLVHMGIGTRNEVKKLIKSKRVQIDDIVVTKSSVQVQPQLHVVTVDSRKIEYKEFFYYLLHKPQGVISATEDMQHKTVIDLLSVQDQRKNIFPVGRLDIDTEGLLLLTNDGKLAHNLLSPKKHIVKQYFAKVKGCVTDEDIATFEKGVVLEDGYECMPAQLRILSAGEISEVEISIKEGKFHQVKRMMISVGKEVIYLKRIAMGNLFLEKDLNIGQYRELKEEEIQNLKRR